MAYGGRLIKTIFSKGPLFRLRTTVCVALSIGLIIVGQSAQPLWQRVTAGLTLSVLPLQYAVNAPYALYKTLVTTMATQRQLLSENAQLRARNFLLQARLQRLTALEKENVELRNLLQSSSQLGGKVVVGELLAVDLSPSLQQMIVNRGARDQIFVGQPVFDAYGVVGQVINVGLFTSKILLLTDTHSAIPVQNNRNNVRAVAMGQGVRGTLVLSDVSETTDIQLGDVMLTSGLDQRYPQGYPVGVVIEKQRVRGEHYLRIVLRPAARLDRAQQVMLTWPSNPALARTVQDQLKQGLEDNP